MTVGNGEAVEANALDHKNMNAKVWTDRRVQVTSLGSRTDASQSIAFRPLMPPRMFST